MGSALGLESGVVRLAEYDAQWEQLYVQEAERLSEAIVPLGLRFEHVGSTSVPGLIAKPVLDILAGFHDQTLLPAYITALTAAGYVHRGEQGIPGREFFRRGEPRSYHLHLTIIHGSFWAEHLLFRDLLRKDQAVLRAYAELKRALASRYPLDREAYIEGKGPFVRAALDKARQGGGLSNAIQEQGSA